MLARFLASLLTGQGIILFWLVFGIVNAVFRFGYSHTLALDDSRASELVQSFALGYQARQPPIYEWTLWAVQQVLGTGIQSFLLLRYTLLAGLGCAVYAATCHAVRDKRFAALASISICANYQIGWTFLETGTQTIVLCLACFCTFDAAMRFLSRASLPRVAWLGIAVGVGFMAKHSYGLVLLSMTLAALSLPELRRHLQDRRLLLSAAIALAIMSPYLIWLTQVRGDVVVSSEHVLITEQAGHVTRALHGLGKLAVSLVTFSTPWILFMAVLAPAAFVPAPKTAVPPEAAERLAGRTILIAVALATVGIIAIGATNIGERYMYPLLIFGPIYMFARIERCAGTERSIEKFGVTLAVCAVILFGIRVFSVIDIGVGPRDPYHTLIAYDQLAKELKARGLTKGTALVPNIRIAGNLRTILPDLRVIATDSFRLQCPPWRPIDGQAGFALWDGVGEDWRVDQMAPFAELPREHLSIQARHSILGGRDIEKWTLVKLDANALVHACCAPLGGKKSCTASSEVDPRQD